MVDCHNKAVQTSFPGVLYYVSRKYSCVGFHSHFGDSEHSYLTILSKRMPSEQGGCKGLDIPEGGLGERSRITSWSRLPQRFNGGCNICRNVGHDAKSSPDLKKAGKIT